MALPNPRAISVCQQRFESHLKPAD
jgi:hypothetical protein